MKQRDLNKLVDFLGDIAQTVDTILIGQRIAEASSDAERQSLSEALSRRMAQRERRTIRLDPSRTPVKRLPFAS